MAYPRLAPDQLHMKKYLARSLTQAQIADEWQKDSGIRVSRAAIGLAIARYELQSTRPRPDHSDFLPWSPIAPEHRNHRDLKMLRLAARREKRLPLSEKETRWLSSWEAELRANNAVILYNPDTTQGFWWTHRKPCDGDGLLRHPDNEERPEPPDDRN